MKKKYERKVPGVHTHESGWVEIAPHPRYPGDPFYSLFLTHSAVTPLMNTDEEVHLWGSHHVPGMWWGETLPSDMLLNGGPETVWELTTDKEFPGKGVEKPEHPPWGKFPPPRDNDIVGYKDWHKTDSLRLSPDQMHVLREALQEVLVKKTRLQADWQLQPEDIHEVNLLREVFWALNIALHGYHHKVCIEPGGSTRMGLDGPVDAAVLDQLDRLESSPPAECANCQAVFRKGIPVLVTLNESCGLDGFGHYPLEDHPPADSEKLFCNDRCFAEFLRNHPEEAVFCISGDGGCFQCGAEGGNFMSAKGEYGSAIDDINFPYYFCSTACAIAAVESVSGYGEE